MQLFPFLFSGVERHFINTREIQPLFGVLWSPADHTLGFVYPALWPQPCTQGWVTAEETPPLSLKLAFES